MFPKDVTTDEFFSLIEHQEIVFVDFWAEWCAPCKQFALVYEQIGERYPQITFVKVKSEEEPILVNLFDIRSIPHLMIFKSGIVIYSDVGNISFSILDNLAQQAIETDISSIA